MWASSGDIDKSDSVGDRAGVRRPDLDPQALFLRVADVQGSYTIPYISRRRT